MLVILNAVYSARTNERLSAMQTNNQFLVSEFVDEEYAKQDEFDTKGSFFEYLSASKVMMQYGLDLYEIQEGLVGGTRDGGCDAVYILCDEVSVKEDTDLDKQIKKSSKIEILVLQSKIEKTFSEDVFLKWRNVSSDLLSFEKAKNNFSKMYSREVIDAFSMIRKVLKIAARKGSLVKLWFLDIAIASQVSDGVSLQADSLREHVKALVGIGNFSCEVKFIDADWLMNNWMQPEETDLILKFTDSYTTVRQRSDCFGLVTLGDYYRFLTNESGDLRTDLFEANVRDYEGRVAVNKAIAKTLSEDDQTEDFWWFNNGVTILASEAMQAAGGEVRVSDPRIVNGLQTTYEIYKYINAIGEADNDKRCVMVRVLIPENEAVRDKVIMATNSQTRVKNVSLRATDPIHLQIELYLKQHNLFYERRKNYYRNMGKKLEDIVSISFLAQCMMSILLSQPDQARARPSTLFADDKRYRQIFPKDGNLGAYLKAAQLGKKVVKHLPKLDSGYSRSEISDLKFYVIMGVAIRLASKSKLNFSDIDRLNVELVDKKLVSDVAEICMDEYKKLGADAAAAKSSALSKAVVSALESGIISE